MISAPTPYRPSNGTEGDLFQEAWCQKCSKDNFDWQTCEGGCPILSNTMAYDIDDPDYPKEWVYGDDGEPRCTAFHDKTSLNPPDPDRCPDTMEMDL